MTVVKQFFAFRGHLSFQIHLPLKPGKCEKKKNVSLLALSSYEKF